MNSISFKTNSLIKNFKNAIKASYHCQQDSKTYFMYKSKLKIDKNVDIYQANYFRNDERRSYCKQFFKKIYNN